MIKKVYFDINRVALGTSEGPEAYYGDYWASEEYDLPEDLRVTGLNATELAAVHRLAVTPRYNDIVMQKVRQKLGLEPYDTSRDMEINGMDRGEVFEYCLEWEGIIGYGQQIRNWVQDIYGVNLI